VQPRGGPGVLRVGFRRETAGLDSCAGWVQWTERWVGLIRMLCGNHEGRMCVWAIFMVPAHPGRPLNGFFVRSVVCQCQMHQNILRNIHKHGEDQ